MTFTHRDSSSNAVQIVFRMTEDSVHGEPFKVNDWFGDVKDKCFRGDRPTHQSDGIWMNGEAKWIWDALVKHYGFIRLIDEKNAAEKNAVNDQYAQIKE